MEVAKLHLLKNLLEKAAKEKTPDDMCYVYNFDNPIVPKALFLPAGKGKELKADMAELIKQTYIRNNKKLQFS